MGAHLCCVLVFWCGGARRLFGLASALLIACREKPRRLAIVSRFSGLRAARRVLNVFLVFE